MENNVLENVSIEKNQTKKECSDLHNTKSSIVFKRIWYIIGAILLFIGIVLLFHDRTGVFDDQYYFYEKGYVGGDAYNYIITAARSTAVMVKSLIFVIMGCTSLLIGRSFNK